MWRVVCILSDHCQRQHDNQQIFGQTSGANLICRVEEWINDTPCMVCTVQQVNTIHPLPLNLSLFISFSFSSHYYFSIVPSNKTIYNIPWSTIHVPLTIYAEWRIPKSPPIILSIVVQIAGRVYVAHFVDSSFMNRTRWLIYSNCQSFRGGKITL